jgi:hypothetical protein
VIEPGKYDITIYQGASFELNLQLFDGDNSPVVMSGYTVAGATVKWSGTQFVPASELADGLTIYGGEF